MNFLIKKIYLLNTRACVVFLVFVQFNKRSIVYINRKCGKPKGRYRLKQSEFGISRNVYSLGKRKIHSTLLEKLERKESSYTEFIRLVLRGSDLYKDLARFNTQFIFFGYSTNLMYLLSNLEFFSLSWCIIKFRNKKLFIRENSKLLNYKFELWILYISRLLKSGNFDFGSNLVFFDSNYSKFFFGDLIISQSMYLLLSITFDCYNRQFMEISDLSHGVKLDSIKSITYFTNLLFTGSLTFNKEKFISLFYARVFDQSLKDLFYKYFISTYFNIFNELEFYEYQMLYFLVMNIHYNKFDEWVRCKLLPIYSSMDHFILCKTVFTRKKNINFFYIRHLSSVFIGLLNTKEISPDLLNRVEEKLYGPKLDLKIRSNFSLHFKRFIFLGYIVSQPCSFLIEVQAPIYIIVETLNKLGFLDNKKLPTRNCKYLNLSLSSILLNYTRIQLVILKQYYFSDNFDDISNKLFYYLRYSCALTFCSKMKLKTLRKTFKKYGFYLSIKIKNSFVSLKVSNLHKRVKNLLR